MPAGGELLGRTVEITALHDLVDAAPQRGGALVVIGEPGVGKSALLTAAQRRATERGIRVLRTAGVQSEATVPFAALHQLLRPILPATHGLPEAHREALRVAFGLSDAAPPQLFRIALAVLDLLAESAARAPLVLIVEDAHWLDRGTADVLAFVARRLESDPVILLAAGREGSEHPLADPSLPQLRLAALDDAAAARLLDAHAPGLAPARRERLLEEAAGNPLALVELPRALEDLGDAPALPPWLPLTTRLERAFAARESELPTRTRALLLVAALNDGDSLAEVVRAAGVLLGAELSVAEIAPAVSAALVTVDETAPDETVLRFRHPLVRSAIRQTAGMARRQAAHAALASVLTDQPDRRVWHRVACRLGPDDEAADELEAAATRAARRGAIAGAVSALERAAQLTEDPARRGGRLLRAAELAFEIGRRDLVLSLLHEAEPLELGPLERPRLSWLREMFEAGQWSGSAKVAAIVEIADRLRLGGDAYRALNALLLVALRCWWANPDGHTRELVVAAAERIPVPEDTPELLATLAFAAPRERGAVVLDRVARLDADAARDPETLRLLGSAATGIGAFPEAPRFLEAAVAGLRAQGRLGLLAYALVSQAWTGIFLGGWRVAISAAEEGARLAVETGQPTWATAAKAAEATVVGLQGDQSAAEALATCAEGLSLSMGATPMLSLVQLARGSTALAAGRHADAYEDLRRIFDPGDIAHHGYVRDWVLVDLVEAAVHSGHTDEARVIVHEFEPIVAETRSPLLRVNLCSVRPLLASDEHAEALFRDALGADLSAWPFLRARVAFAYGTWLRRHRRAVESRPLLRAAREAFDALGARTWGERARQELRASGETSRVDVPEGRDDLLTPQELQIARMAAQGLSNREIGQRLFLSHRTVGTHLYRTFPKLGITSRSELHGALSGPRVVAV
ncbi:ATP-binding protein [Pseudonocardia xinjiangensis]|uniref:ATP-binding protein n=1 Tax=Pseudonocardia xinjiangensis TaxID=75289 RepID=UPI003D90F0BB